MYYAYRYQIFKDGKPTTRVSLTHDDKFMEILKSEGSCTRWAYGLSHNTTRVKPRNVLIIPSSITLTIYTDTGICNWKASQRLRYSLLKSLALIPWSVPFDTLNLDDYPELFI